MTQRPAWAPEGIPHPPFQEDNNNSATHCRQEVGGALFDLPQITNHEGVSWGGRGTGDWQVTSQHGPLPGQPGQMEIWSTSRKRSLPYQEANPSWPETQPKPRIHWAGGRKGSQRPVLDSSGRVSTHAHTHFTGGKWRPREDKRLSRDPLYSLSVQIPFSKNGCKVNL